MVNKQCQAPVKNGVILQVQAGYPNKHPLQILYIEGWHSQSRAKKLTDLPDVIATEALQPKKDKHRAI